MDAQEVTSIDRWNARDEGRGMGWVTIIALVVAIALHVALFVFLDQIEFFQTLKTDRFKEESVVMEQVVLEDLPETIPEEFNRTVPELSEMQDPITELEDLLPEMKNQDLDMLTTIESPELSIKMSTPAKAGNLSDLLQDTTLSANIQTAMTELGTGITSSLLAAEGQVIIKEGSVDGELLDSVDILDNTSVRGIEGFSLDGVMEGYNSLDELMSMSTISLKGARAALPSDLLFNYDSAELKPKARFGLMKIAMLIDMNPEMYCILEGHTDTYGGDAYNQNLSVSRARSVKDWLTRSMHLDGKKIIVRGFGKTRPLVTDGSIEVQAPNRRVDILMRSELTAQTKPKTLAPQQTLRTPQTIHTEDQVNVPQAQDSKTTAPLPQKKAIIIEEPSPEPVELPAAKQESAILVKPRINPLQRAIIIEEEEEEEEIPRAIPLD